MTPRGNSEGERELRRRARMGELCAFIAKHYPRPKDPINASMILTQRHVARVRESMDGLDDEIYEAAANGRMQRAAYLEYVRGRVPEWVAGNR